MAWPTLPPHILATNVAGRIVLVNRLSGAMHLSNESGALILRSRGDHATLDHAAAELGQHFGVDTIDLANQLREFDTELASLASTGMARAPILRPAVYRRPEASPPDTTDHVFELGAFGVHVHLVSHDVTTTSLLEPLVQLMVDPGAPDETVNAWISRNLLHVAWRSRQIVATQDLTNGLSTAISLVTATIVDASPQLLLHAATVVTDGGAIVLAGSTNQGKSSTTVELVRGGAAYVTDEISHVDPVSGFVSGLARPVGLEGQARLRHPDLAPNWTQPGDSTFRWPVPPMAIGRSSAGAPLSALVILSFDRQSSYELRRLPAFDALGHLGPQIVNPSVLTQELFSDLGSLLERIPAYIVHHSGSESAANAISTLRRS